MSDTLLAVLIGGAIGVIPSLVIVMAEYWKMKKIQQHELMMKQFELYESNKISILVDYLERLGSLNAGSLSANFSFDSFYAAAEKAACFVSEDIRTMIFQANEFAASWKKGFDHEEFKELQLAISNKIDKELKMGLLLNGQAK